MIQPIKFFLILTLAFVINYLMTHIFRRLAFQVGLVDTPQGRKRHVGQVPLVGGLAMFCSFILAMGTAQISLTELRPFLVGASIIVLTGILDDLKEISPLTKLLGQFAAALVMILWGHNVVDNLVIFQTNNIYITALSWVITLVFILGFINAINFLDGIDGLTASVSCVILITMLLMAKPFFNFNELLPLAVFIPLLLSFLCFNFPLPQIAQRRVFLGDTGSMLLGYTMAWYGITISESQHVIQPMIILFILAYPIFDLCAVSFYRISHGRSPFSPDRRHGHHALLKIGCSSLATVMIIAAINIAFALVAYALYLTGLRQGWLFLIFVSTLCAYVFWHYATWRFIHQKTKVGTPTSL